MAGSVGYAYRQVETPTGEKKEQLLDAGENPPAGVIVQYWLPETPAGDLTLAFLDAGGRELRTFTSRPAPAPVEAAPTAPPGATGGEEPSPQQSSPPPAAEDEPRPTKQAGGNRFVWNLRGKDATKLPDNKGRGGTVEALVAPRVPPGAYQVRLTVNGRTLTQPLQVVNDPRLPATDEDLRAQYALAHRAHDLLTRVHDAVLTLRDVRAQAEGWAARVASARVREAARGLARTLTAIEGELIQVRAEDPRMFPSKLNSRLATVVTLIEYSDGMPTRALHELHDTLAARVQAELAKLARCLAEDVAAFNALCFDEGAAAITPRPQLG
jgi:hypothetical protein